MISADTVVMADNPFPANDDWAKWSYAQALGALTGETVDLWHLTWTPTAPKQTPDKGTGETTYGAVADGGKGTALADVKWFMFDQAAASKALDDSDPSKRNAPQDITYYAWDKQYFGVNIDRNAIEGYETACDDLTNFVLDLLKLQRGQLDGYSLGYFRDNVVELENYLSTKAGDYRKLANDLKSSDSAFQGKAAAVIHEWLDHYAGALETWRDKVNGNHGLKLSDAIMNAWNGITGFVNSFHTVYQELYSLGFRSFIRNSVNQLADSVYQYLVGNGLIAGTSNYLGNPGAAGIQTGSDGVPYTVDYTDAEIKTFIDKVLSQYPMPDGTKADLRDPSTWGALNKAVSTWAAEYPAALDYTARQALPRLSEGFWMLSRALYELADPPPFTHVGPNSYGGGNTPPYGANMPPIDFNIPPIHFDTGNAPPYYGSNSPPYYGSNSPPYYGSNSPPYYGGNSPPYLGGPNVPSNVFEPLAHMFDPVANLVPNGLFNPLGHMFDPVANLVPGNLFDPFARLASGLGNVLPPGLFDPLAHVIPSNLFDPLAHLTGLANLSPRSPFGNQGGFNGTGALPPGTLLGPNGTPQLGRNGELLGQNHQPLLGPHGELLGPAGQPLLGPHGELLGPAGKPLLGPHGELLGPGGKPLRGPDGQLLTVGPGGQISTLPGGGITATAGAGVPGRARFNPTSGGGVPDLVGNPNLGLGLSGSLPKPTSGSPTTVDGSPAAGTGMGGMGGMPYGGMGGMGGGMGNGEKKERERQTWLSEDEKVWGTDVTAGLSVIGRPEEGDDDTEADELVLPLGPVRSRRPAPGRPHAAHQTGAAGNDDQDETAAGRG